MAGFNVLYPPIVDTYMPAFVISAIEDKSVCNIYFSLSQFNEPEDIKSVWVTVNNQYTNQSVLKDPVGIKAFNTLNIDSSRSGDDKYYITLTSKDIEGGWVLDQQYKVQIRFCSEKAPSQIKMDWIVGNSHLFSEWSTVTLVQGISQPVLSLKNFATGVPGEEVIISSFSNSVLAGYVDFKDREELESYYFEIYDRDNLDSPVFKSEIIYTDDNNPNEINCLINYAFIDGNRYIMYFTYTTIKQYQQTIEFPFMIIESIGDPIQASIKAEGDSNNGYIEVSILPKENLFNNVMIRRTSNLSHFMVWEDVHIISVADSEKIKWRDYTVESGIWYKYGIQTINRYGIRGEIVVINKPVMITLEDIFLSCNNQQLKIKFNPQINSYKQTLTESLTNTLGSKYPFIKRNGHTNYKQFNISGLISHFMDDVCIFKEGDIYEPEEISKNGFFMNEEDKYLYQKKLYQSYNKLNDISEYNDFTLEKNFREKVQEFLYANDVKLFRAPSERNLLVRLMNVSLTPEKTLGGMLYSFTATAYEIDESSIKNFEKYNIQKIGSYRDYILQTETDFSHYSDVLNGDIISLLQEEQNYKSDKGRERKIVYLDSLSMEFQSKPYLINTSANPPTILTKSTEVDKNTVLGYLVKINDAWIIISSRGRYNLEDTKITSLLFPTEMDVSLNCTCYIEEREDASSSAYQVIYILKVGQLWGAYRPSDSLVKNIYTKYNVNNKNWYQRVHNINSFNMEAEPGTIFYIKDIALSEEDKSIYKRIEIGETGVLNLEDLISVEDAFVAGIHLKRKTDGETIRDSDFVEYNSLVYNDVQEILNPAKNGVYYVKDNVKSWLDYSFEWDTEDMIENNNYFNQMNEALTPLEEIIDGVPQEVYRVIYYQNHWYQFSKNNDVIKPVEILLDYYYDLERGAY